MLPPLCTEGHVLVVTSEFPPRGGGSSVTMCNLLSCFDPASFTVAGVASRERRPLEGPAGVRPVPIAVSPGAGGRLAHVAMEAQVPVAALRAASLARSKGACAVVGVYPYVQIIDIAYRAARLARLPFVPYLHDTIAEGMSGRLGARKAVRLHERVLGSADHVLVISDGMRDLYRRKYGVDCTVVRHTYPEPMPADGPEGPGNGAAFWGGLVYTINQCSFARVAEAVRTAGVRLTLATENGREDLERKGVMFDNAGIAPMFTRAEYLKCLGDHSLLVLALDWPDESPVHEEELATIFPTKTPEYLAAGRPIVVHCPERYFLAEFFREHGCGVLVTDRSKGRLLDACRQALAGGGSVRAAQAAALKAARLFDASAVADCLRDRMDRVVGATRGGGGDL
ncbi:MAG: glycosyltransferase [Armatimonadetes bacterium]|nr:glycosyltransferase [Armatimonadota bacterium]